LALARSAAAAPCEEYANELRADLKREARRTRVWTWAWRITYTVGAVSELGALNAWFAPPHIEVPVSTGDACTDKSQLRGARERNASNELALTWSAHISGLIVNGIGTLVLADRV